MDKELQEYLIELGYSKEEAEWYDKNVQGLETETELIKNYYECIGVNIMKPINGVEYAQTPPYLTKVASKDGAKKIIIITDGNKYTCPTEDTSKGFTIALTLIQSLMNNKDIPEGWVIGTN